MLTAWHGLPIMYAGAPGRVVSFVPDDPPIQAALDISICQDPVSGNRVAMGLSRPVDPHSADTPGMPIR